MLRNLWVSVVRKILISLVSAFGVCGSAMAAPIVVDFDARQAGEIADGQINPFVSLTTSGGAGAGIIFDTNNPTGGDGDLVPNVLVNPSVSGPDASGNVLIVAERLTDTDMNGLVDNPDDNAGGGTFSFTFNEAVSFLGLNAVDFTDGGSSLTVELFGSTGQLLSTTIASLSGPGVDIVASVGDNAYFRLFENVFGTEGIAGVTRADITLTGSGAIDTLVFDVSEIPVPAALPLMASALAFGGFVARRRKQSARI